MAYPTTLKWVTICTVVLVLIIGPFFLFGAQIEAWTQAFLDQAGQHRLASALVLGGLLATDIVFPVPSSLVSTGCGLFLGFAWGTIVSLAGMVVSCAAGFGLGVVARPLARRMVGQRELERLERLNDRFGDWVIVLTRPVPVLAEASVLFAGTGSMPVGRFFALSTLSNLCISAVYAAVGSFSANANSFLLAVAGSAVIPGLAILLMHRTPVAAARGSRQIQISNPPEADDMRNTSE